MATIGYIFTNNYKAEAKALTDGYRQMMSDIVNCDKIIEETADQEKLRPQWRTLLGNLKRGDTLIIVKFSNALRGIRETGAFLDLCLRYDIRLISVLNKIDTDGILFPETTNKDILQTIANISAEVNVLRRSIYKGHKVKSLTKPKTLKAGLKMDREQTIIKMYNAGHQINEIWHASGYKSRTSVFRVLKRNGIELNRMKK